MKAPGVRQSTVIEGMMEQTGTASYWSDTRLPLACLVFLAPLLACYEAGVLYLGGTDPHAIRNGADFWMRAALERLGFDHTLLLPALVIGALLAWHMSSRRPWRVSAETLAGMFAESLLFAFVLIVLGQLQDLMFQRLSIDRLLSIGDPQTAIRVVTFIGAGVYEEVMFRLCLLPAAYGLFRLLRFEPFWAAAQAVVASSLAFAAAHYVGPSADEWTLFSFTFRGLAGLFFALLFVTRGFGITVGCHAAYDLLVGVLMSTES